MSGPADWLVIGVRLERGTPNDAAGDDGEAVLAEALLELGGRAVAIVDGWLETHLPLGSDAPDSAGLAARLAEITGLPHLEVRTRVQPHEDWAELWKRGLAPRRVGRRLIVTPSWCEPDAGPDDEVLVLDPGMAFGNAEHGTTRGCLRLLESVVSPGERVLDVGSGSGVLAIAAARLGADRVVALEADDWAIEAALENVRANAVFDRVEVRRARADVDGLRAEAPVDGVLANIEAGVLEPLLPGFRAALRPGGWLILSGILDTQLDALLRSAEAEGFTPEQVDADGEWRSVLLR